MDDGAARLEREFNGYGEVERQTLTVNGAAVGEVALTRDDVGRITAKTETIAGVTHEYAYDLTVVRDGAGSELERYTYGPQGERLTETNVLRGIVSRSFTYDDEDRLLTAGSAEYEFDADGFLTSKSDGSETTTYDYSSRGELKQVELPSGEVVEYQHDPLGRRVAKLVDGEVTEKYLWSGRTTLLAVYNGDDTLKSRFLYADGRMPTGMVQDGETYYVVYDQVGSLRAVTDAEGSVIKTIRYDSFGNVIEDTNPEFDVPFGFAGGLHDKDTGLVRFGHRDYDPETGRWTAKDPIGFEGGDVNVFGYVLQCPVHFVDPTGLEIQLHVAPAFFTDGFPPVYQLNHVYVWSTQLERGRGMSGSTCSRGDGVGVNKVHNSPYTVVELPPGISEEMFMRDIENYPDWDEGVYCPYRNDCHNQLEKAFEYAGVPYPGTPHGRFNIDDYAFGNIVNDGGGGW